MATRTNQRSPISDEDGDGNLELPGSDGLDMSGLKLIFSNYDIYRDDATGNVVVENRDNSEKFEFTETGDFISDTVSPRSQSFGGVDYVQNQTPASPDVGDVWIPTGNI